MPNPKLIRKCIFKAYSLATLLLDWFDSNEVFEIQPCLVQHRCMQCCSFHALLPSLASLINTTQLPQQYCVEVIDVLLGPLDTSRHHDWRETGLEDESCILDYGKIDERYLIDVDMQVAVKNALSEKQLAFNAQANVLRHSNIPYALFQNVTASFEVDISSAIIET